MPNRESRPKVADCRKVKVAEFGNQKGLLIRASSEQVGSRKSAGRERVKNKYQVSIEQMKSK